MNDEYEPICAEARMHIIDYVDLSDYAASWPDKLVSFFCEHLVDDEYQPFVRDFYEYACQRDTDGPAFEEWRKS